MTTIDNFKEITREEAQLLVDLGAPVYFRPTYHMLLTPRGPWPWICGSSLDHHTVLDLWVKKEDEAEEEVPNYRSCL